MGCGIILQRHLVFLQTFPKRTAEFYDGMSKVLVSKVVYQLTEGKSKHPMSTLFSNFHRNWNSLIFIPTNSYTSLQKVYDLTLCTNSEKRLCTFSPSFQFLPPCSFPILKVISFHQPCFFPFCLSSQTLLFSPGKFSEGNVHFLTCTLPTSRQNSSLKVPSSLCSGLHSRPSSRL